MNPRDWHAVLRLFNSSDAVHFFLDLFVFSPGHTLSILALLFYYLGVEDVLQGSEGAGVLDLWFFGLKSQFCHDYRMMNE